MRKVVQYIRGIRLNPRLLGQSRLKAHRVTIFRQSHFRGDSARSRVALGHVTEWIGLLLARSPSCAFALKITTGVHLAQLAHWKTVVAEQNMVMRIYVMSACMLDIGVDDVFVLTEVAHKRNRGYILPMTNNLHHLVNHRTGCR